MAKSSFRLTVSQTSIIQLAQTDSPESPKLPPCQLRWRSNQLWVKAVCPEQASLVPAVQNEQWIADCLKHSSVRLVCLDFKLGDIALQQWADMASAAKKQVYVRLPQSIKAQVNQSVPKSWLDRVFHQLVASLLLIGFAPIIMLVAGALRLGPTPIFDREWAIGRRGRLLRLWQFQPQQQHRTGKFMKRNLLQHVIVKAQLHRLPGLINTALGETRLGFHLPVKISSIGKSKFSSSDATVSSNAVALSPDLSSQN